MLTIMTLPFLTGNRTLLSGTKCHYYGTCKTDYLEYIERKMHAAFKYFKNYIIFLFVDLFMRRSDEKENIFFKFHLF